MDGMLKGVSICMLGGDRRELELAKALLEQLVNLRLVGFEFEPGLEEAEFVSDPVVAVKDVQVVIAPMSNTDLTGKIKTRLDKKEPIDLLQIIGVLPERTILFVGVAKPVIQQAVYKKKLLLVETAEVDEIAILNSIPTAEGAIQLAMEQKPITIHGSKCLVLGFGRCGMTLARKLDALGANVTVASRNVADLARIVEMGLKPLLLSDLDTETNFDFVFNTIPALVLTASYLELINKDALIIDLAAEPGGTDFHAAKEFGILAILALSLPGKVAPITSGQILIRCIPRLINRLLERNDAK
ncbi:MAG: dipicolinate synthase subunit DpsA [Firmicutes bacterium]|nr:dipicolinate synthase subunit DpsA [Bacillota bacterium]